MFINSETKKVYHLRSCDTCRKFIKEMDFPKTYTLHEIKRNPISEDELDALAQKVGSYEALFNKRSRLNKEQKLTEKIQNDLDYKKLILEHYTLMKRPIVVTNNLVFYGNITKIIKELRRVILE